MIYVECKVPTSIISAILSTGRMVLRVGVDIEVDPSVGNVIILRDSRGVHSPLECVVLKKWDKEGYGKDGKYVLVEIGSGDHISPDLEIGGQQEFVEYSVPSRASVWALASDLVPGMFICRSPWLGLLVVPEWMKQPREQLPPPEVRVQNTCETRDGFSELWDRDSLLYRDLGSKQ